MKRETTILWISFLLHLFVAHGFLVGSSGAHKTDCTIKCSTEETTNVAQNLKMTSTRENSTPNLEESALIRNFRAAYGTNRIYRCANTDGLGSIFEGPGPFIVEEDTPESIILNRSQLILDLRSPSERNEDLAKLWMLNAPGGKIEILNYDRERSDTSQLISSCERCVLRVDLLSPTRLFKYLEKNWINGPIETAQYSFSYTFDSKKLHEMRMEILNNKGLPGLYEAMIETSGPEIFASLQAITVQLEAKGGDIVIHCVQGKDRTGILVMLCQAMLGVNDDEIIKDYHASDQPMREGSAALDSVATSKEKLNRNIFSGAPKEAMVNTLNMIRIKHVSVNDYLDSIGFDANWRHRFITASSLRNKL